MKRLFIWTMNSRPSVRQLALLAILAGLLGATALLYRAARDFSFGRRDFRPDPAALLVLAAVFFTLLVASWVLYSRAAARRFGLRPEAVLAGDFLSFLPGLLLSLAPLALAHYIDAGDLKTRLGLYFLAVGAACLALKIAAARDWARGNGPLAGWVRRFEALSLRRRTGLLFAAAVIIYGAGSLALISRGATFSGDEPHYLIISQSLLADGDLDLADNYARKDYRSYMGFSGDIAPHVVNGDRPGSLYSFHSPGASFLLLPFYAAGRALGGQAWAFLIRLGMGLWGALFSVQVYLLARRRWPAGGAALGLWFLAGFSSPVFFYAIHVYPEIIVAALALMTYRLLEDSPSLGPGRAAACGLFLGSFIWFHALKYLALFAPLFLYGLWTLRRKAASRTTMLLYVLAPAAVIGLYLQFQHALYGTYSPFAVSWARPMTATGGDSLKFAGSLLFGVPLRDRLETLAGYFLDQRDGLFLYAPVYLFALLGAWEMLKKRRRELVVLLFLGAPYVLLSAFLTQRAGYAPQARPLVAVIWIMVIALGRFSADNAGTAFARLKGLAAAAGLLFVGLLLRQPLGLYQETTRGTTERGGDLFYLLSNLHFDLTRLLPSYLKVEDRRWLPNLVGPVLLVVFVLAYAVFGKKRLRLGFGGRTAAACAGVALFFAGFVLYPRLVLTGPSVVKSPSGARIIFYSLSRSARSEGPGRFALREDGRSYRFYFTTDRPAAGFDFEFGSRTGEHETAVRLFDETIFARRTAGEVRRFRLEEPAGYRLGRRRFYAITLELGRGTTATTDRTPYLFAIDVRPAPG